MLRGYTYIQNIGSGVFGIADLYEKDSKYYVVKTQKVLAEEVDGYDLRPDSRFAREIKFFDFVHALHYDYTKYFMQMYGYQIVRDIPFDDKLLRIIKPEMANELDKKLAVSKDKIYYRALLSYAGNTVQYYIFNMIKDKKYKELYEFARKVADDLIKIISITWHGYFLIDDIHTGNICWYGNNAVLIDYGDIKYIDNNSSIRDTRNYELKYDLWSVIRFGSDANYYNYKLPEKIVLANMNAIRKSIFITSIRKYLIDIFSRCDLADDIHTILASNKREDLIHVIDFADTLWLIFDQKNHNKFWRKVNKKHESSFFKLSKEYMFNILDNYHTILN